MADTLPVRYADHVESIGPSVRSAQTAERYRAALEMRARGAEYYQIGEFLEITEQQAADLVKRALKQVLRDPSDEVRKMELKRLDMLTQVYMDKALEGHGPSCDRVLMIMERRARIEGIDAPVEIDYASIRSQFFHVLRQVMPPEKVAEVLQAMAEVRT